jgi:hypothetical protein
MSTPTTIEGDMVVSGHLRAGSMELPIDSVGNAEVDVSDPINNDKQWHRVVCNCDTLKGVAVTAFRKLAYLARSPGTIMDLRIALGVACTGTTSFVKVGIWKNGVLISSTLATCNPTHAAYVQGQQGTFSTSTFTTGDTLEFEVTVAAGDGVVGQELLAVLTINERPV